MGKRMVSRKTDVLRASEIGQYCYCSCAWKLQRMGYEPESAFLQPGTQAHVALGERLDGLETRMRYSRWAAVVGFLALGLAVLLFFLGVV